MGRNKITIRRIENERSRQATFMKRKAGLVKKAMELSILCDCEVALVIFSSSNKLFLYSSESTEHIMNRFAEHTDPYRPLTNADYMRQFGGSPDKDAPDSPPQQQQQQQQQQSGPARHGSLSRAAKAAAARAREIEENAEELPSIPHMGMSMGTVAAAAVAAASAAVGGSAAAEAATTGKHKHGKGAPPPAAAAAAEELSGAQTPPPPVSPSLMGPTTLAQALSGAASQISSSLGLSNDPEQYVLTPRTAARYRTVNLKYMVPSPAAAAAIGGSGAMATTPSSFLSPTGTSLFSPLKGFYSPTSYPFGPLPSPSAASLGLGMPLSPTTPYFAIPSANPNAFTAQLGEADEPAAAAAPGAEQPAAPAAEQPSAPAPAPAPTEAEAAAAAAATAATSTSPASSTTSASPKQKYKKNLSVVIPENRGIDRSVHPVSAAEIVPSSLLHPSSSPADSQGRGGSGGSSEASALLAAAAARGSLHSGSAPSAAAAATTAAAEDDDDVAMNEEPTSQSPHSRPADDKLPAKKRRVTFEDTPLSKVAKREDG